MNSSEAGFKSTHPSHTLLLLSNETFNNPFSQFIYAPDTLRHGFSSALQPVHEVYSLDALALAAIAYNGFQVQNGKCGPGQAPYPQTCRHREAGTPAEATADMVYTPHQLDLEAIPVCGHQVTAYASGQAARQAADIVLLPDHVTSTLHSSTLGETPAGSTKLENDSFPSLVYRESTRTRRNGNIRGWNHSIRTPRIHETLVIHRSAKSASKASERLVSRWHGNRSREKAIHAREKGGRKKTEI